MERPSDDPEPLDEAETPILSALSAIPTNFASKADVIAFLKNPEFRIPPAELAKVRADGKVPTNFTEGIEPTIFGDIELFHFRITGFSIIAFGETRSQPGRFCVIKFINPRSFYGLDAKQRIKRFRREIEFLSRHQENPLWVRIQKADEGSHPFFTNPLDKYPYIILEFCPGVHGASFCEAPAFRGLSARPEFLSAFALASLRIFADTAAGNRVLRDFKPENVIVTRSGFKFLDPGVITEHGSDLTPTERVLGTPETMSPEQAQNYPLDFRSDLYSLGCCLFYFATKKFPFEGASAYEVMIKHIGEPVPTAQLNCLPPLLREAILTLLSKRPGNRFQSLEDAADCFHPFVKGTEMENFLPPTCVHPPSFMPLAIDE